MSSKEDKQRYRREAEAALAADRKAFGVNRSRKWSAGARLIEQGRSAEVERFTDTKLPAAQPKFFETALVQCWDCNMVQLRKMGSADMKSVEQLQCLECAGQVEFLSW